LRLVLSKLGFTLYSVFALLIQVPPSQPSPGTYYIVNSVLSVTGKKLAAAYLGFASRTDVTVFPLDMETGDQLEQVWLYTSSYILLFVSLDFAVEYRICQELGAAINNTCSPRGTSSNIR
jgi:hypothetical protein